MANPNVHIPIARSAAPVKVNAKDDDGNYNRNSKCELGVVVSYETHHGASPGGSSIIHPLSRVDAVTITN